LSSISENDKAFVINEISHLTTDLEKPVLFLLEPINNPLGLTNKVEKIGYRHITSTYKKESSFEDPSNCLFHAKIR